MKYFKFYSLLLFAFILLMSTGTENTGNKSGSGMEKSAVAKLPAVIHHTVFFKLKTTSGSTEEQEFFRASEVLGQIPGVRNFQRLREVSKKNGFDHGFSMEFVNQVLYDQYSNHISHNKFVKEFWEPYVAEFMEIDFEVLKN
ncbi:MAG TPA: Dabb family protein [Cyclobacteriaceae bacterium]|nr:Dabb family protein [Cyclobacteriaceae bacterium]